MDASLILVAVALIGAAIYFFSGGEAEETPKKSSLEKRVEERAQFRAVEEKRQEPTLIREVIIREWQPEKSERRAIEADKYPSLPDGFEKERTK